MNKNKLKYFDEDINQHKSKKLKSNHFNQPFYHDENDWVILSDLEIIDSNKFRYKAEKLNGKINGLNIGVCKILKIVKNENNSEDKDNNNNDDHRSNINDFNLNKSIECLLKLNEYKHTLKYYGCGKDSDQNIYFYMENVENSISVKELINLLPNNRLDQYSSFPIAFIMVKALKDLHDMELYHGDISCENIFFVYDKIDQIITGVKYINFKLPLVAIGDEISEYKNSDIDSLYETFLKMLDKTKEVGYSYIYKTLKAKINNRLNDFISQIDQCENFSVSLNRHSITNKSNITMILFNEPIVVGSIPNGVEELILTSFNQSIEAGSIPNSVTDITLPSFNKPITIGTIPNSVTYLTLPSFNQPTFTIGSIPNSVTDVILSSFKQPITAGFIPNSVKYLTLSNNEAITVGSIPKSVIYLTFTSFKQQPLTSIGPILNDITYIDILSPTKLSDISDHITPSLKNLTINKEDFKFQSLFSRPPFSEDHLESEWEVIKQIKGEVKLSKKSNGLIQGIPVNSCIVKNHNFREFCILYLLKDNKYLMKCYGRGFDHKSTTDKNHYTYREYIESATSISDRLKTNSNSFEEEDKIIKIAAEIAHGLKSIHDCGIVHGDLNSDHILIIPPPHISPHKRVSNGNIATDPTIKLIGFRSSIDPLRYIKHKLSHLGKETHMAPEVRNQASNLCYKSDIWSFGCVLIEMAGGDLKERDEKGAPKIPKNLSNYLKNIIQQCLQINLDGRFNIERLIKHLDKDYKKIISKSKKFHSFDQQLTYESLQSIPHDIEYLELLNFNEKIKPALIPGFIKTLSLPSFNQEISLYDFSPSITKLLFTKLNLNIAISPSITHLDLGNEFDLEKNGEYLRDSLITILKCAYPFRVPFNQKWIPESVTKLTLSNYNLPINSNSIPLTLISLTLGNDFDDLISLSKLPNSIITLKFGTKSKELNNITLYIKPSITKLIVNGNRISTVLVLNTKIQSNEVLSNAVDKVLIHFKEQWERICDLGKGAFGSVFKAKKISGNINGFDVEFCTIKMIEKEKFRIDEINILEQLKDSKYSFKYYGCGMDDKHVYIYGEFIEGAISIADKLTQLPNNRLDEDDIIPLAIQIVIGLQYIHNQKIIYRDIKCGHILLIYDDDNNRNGFKFIDFGLSKNFGNHSNYFSILGTESHMAPEVKTGFGTSNRKSDVYALGCTFIEMAGGDLNKKDENGSPIIPSHLSDRFRNIIQLCLVVNINARIDVDTLLNLLSTDDTLLNLSNEICEDYENEDYLEFNEPITRGSIKEGIKYLSLPIFNNTIEAESIPSSVTHLSFKVFNQNVECDSIPQSVTYLDLGNDFDFQTNGLNIPDDTITTFKCGYQFTEIIRPRSIPRSVTNLQLTNYNLKINKGAIPPSVISLTLGNNLTNIESLSNLPTSIINLKFGISTDIKLDDHLNLFKTSTSSLIINGEEKRNKKKKV